MLIPTHLTNLHRPLPPSFFRRLLRLLTVHTHAPTLMLSCFPPQPPVNSGTQRSGHRPPPKKGTPLESRVGVRYPRAQGTLRAGRPSGRGYVQTTRAATSMDNAACIDAFSAASINRYVFVDEVVVVGGSARRPWRVRPRIQAGQATATPAPGQPARRAGDSPGPTAGPFSCRPSISLTILA